MTVGEVKDILAKYPRDWRVYIRIPDDCGEGDLPVVTNVVVTHYRTEHNVPGDIEIRGDAV